jgi:hypothetical protein
MSLAGSTDAGDCTTEVVLATDYIVTLSLGLPISKAEFDSSKQIAFRQGIANVAGVVLEKVIIITITSKRRRSEGITIDLEIMAKDSSVASSVAGRLTVDSINDELEQAGLPKAEILKAPVVTDTSAGTTRKSNTTTILISVLSIVTVLLLVLLAVLIYRKRRSSRKAGIDDPLAAVGSSSICCDVGLILSPRQVTANPDEQVDSSPTPQQIPREMFEDEVREDESASSPSRPAAYWALAPGVFLEEEMVDVSRSARSDLVFRENEPSDPAAGIIPGSADRDYPEEPDEPWLEIPQQDQSPSGDLEWSSLLTPFTALYARQPDLENAIHASEKPNRLVLPVTEAYESSPGEPSPHPATLLRRSRETRSTGDSSDATHRSCSSTQTEHSLRALASQPKKLHDGNQKPFDWLSPAAAASMQDATIDNPPIQPPLPSRPSQSHGRSKSPRSTPSQTPLASQQPAFLSQNVCVTPPATPPALHEAILELNSRGYTQVGPAPDCKRGAIDVD